jgi:hypothetical protein
MAVEGFGLGPEDRPGDDEPVPDRQHLPDRLLDLHPLDLPAHAHPCEDHVALELAQLERLGPELGERLPDGVPPPAHPAVAAVGDGFGLRDQGRELDLGIDGHDEALEVVRADRLPGTPYLLEGVRHARR